MHLALLAALALLGPQTGQKPSKPPIKMGLWETTTGTTIEMPGMAMPPGMGNRTTSMRSCATPESYAEAFQQQGQQRSCQRTNEKWSSNSYSFDVTCSEREGNSKGHFEITFDTAEAGHGGMQIETTAGEHSLTMQMNIKTHWVSADCGPVAPGKAILVR